MRRLLITLSTIMAGFCFSVPVHALELPLTYEKYPLSLNSGDLPNTIQYSFEVVPPSGDWKFPKLTCSHPLYIFTLFGDSKRLIILDFQKADDVFYSRMYFDSNDNKDLTDDPVIDGTLYLSNSSSYADVRFPSVDTTIDRGRKKLPYSFKAGISGRVPPELKNTAKGNVIKHISNYFTFNVMVDCYYSCDFQVKNRQYRMIVQDSNVNGRFNDRFIDNFIISSKTELSEPLMPVVKLIIMMI